MSRFTKYLGKENFDQTRNKPRKIKYFKIDEIGKTYDLLKLQITKLKEVLFEVKGTFKKAKDKQQNLV